MDKPVTNENTPTLEQTPIEAAREYYELHRADINRDLIRVSNAVLAVGCGVGENKISAVRKMLGVDRMRKTYIGPIRKFMRLHPNFREADAATEQSRELFWAREKEKSE